MLRGTILSKCFSTASKDAKTAVFMLNLGGPNNLQEVSPFLERFFADSTVIRIPFGLGIYEESMSYF